MKKYVVALNMSAERINRIMDKGWKLERITKLGTYVFEKTKEKYVCMIRLRIPKAEMKEEYDKVSSEIEQYKRAGAHIISQMHTSEIELEDFSEKEKLCFSDIPEEGIDCLYYIVIPKRKLTDEEIQESEKVYYFFVQGNCTRWALVLLAIVMMFESIYYLFFSQTTVSYEWIEWLQLLAGGGVIAYFIYSWFIYLRYKLGKNIR